MKPLISKVAIVVFGIMIMSAATVLAGEVVQYDLSKEKIKKVSIAGAGEGRYTVMIELTKKNREVFAKLTGNSVGRTLVVTISDHVLTRAVIRGKIDSGIISVGDFDLRNALTKMAEIFEPKHVGSEKENAQ